MTGLVLAAGIGSRLRPFTLSHPKALALVGGVPVLYRAIDAVIAAGASEVIVNVHHFAQQVIDAVKGRQWPVPVRISDESECLLDTAGAIAKIVREHPEAAASGVLVHNADIVTDIELASMSAIAGADAVLLADPQRKSSRRLLFDDCKRLHGWLNMGTGAVKPAQLNPEEYVKAAFGGIHYLGPRALAQLDFQTGPLHPWSIIDFYVSNASALDIRSFTPPAHSRWHDIGTPDKLAEADKAFT